MVKVSVTQVHRVRRLCLEGARRLNHSARLLLQNEGDDGVVFSLWTLAVEEFGKSYLLADQVTGRSESEQVMVQPNFDHERSLERGFAELPALRSDAWRELRVVRPSGSNQVVNDRHAEGSTLCIPTGLTGTFRETKLSLTPSKRWRFDTLYVSWNSRENDWTDNRGLNGTTGVSGRWTFASDQLQYAIDALERALGSA